MPENCKSAHPKNVLINLNAHMGPHAEAKCISINPVRPELIAVGANDPFVRVYDRRMLSCKGIKFPTDSSSRLVTLYYFQKQTFHLEGLATIKLAWLENIQFGILIITTLYQIHHLSTSLRGKTVWNKYVNLAYLTCICM